MGKGVNNLKSPEIEFLELELGELNSKQIELINILGMIDFDFENFEPVFVQYPDGRQYVFQARRDALVSIGDVLLFSLGSSHEDFRTSIVSMTFDTLDENTLKDVNFDALARDFLVFGHVRYIVANLGSLDGAFFEDYFYETNRAKVAKKKEYYESIAKFDSTMNNLLDKLEKLGGPYE